MKLEDFDPPILAEKSSAQYKREIFGDNWERMTPQKLKWLIALSGPANDKYYGKGETRRGPGPGIDDRQFPTKAKRKKTSKARTGKNSMVVGPSDEPSKPFDAECNGNNACIARKAKDLVDQYFRERPPGQPLASPMHVKDTQRKRAKTPRLTVDQDGQPTYKAPRPTGTYAQTGKKRQWGGVSINTGRRSSPVISKKDVQKMVDTAPAEKERTTRQVNVDKPKRVRSFSDRRKKKPGKPADSASKPSPEQMQRAEKARRLANKGRARGGGARSGQQRPDDIRRESRDYTSDNSIDEKISQALYG